MWGSAVPSTSPEPILGSGALLRGAGKATHTQVCRIEKRIQRSRGVLAGFSATPTRERAVDQYGQVTVLLAMLY